MSRKGLMGLTLAVLGVISMSGQAQAQYNTGYRPNQGGSNRNYGNYGYAPSGRPYASQPSQSNQTYRRPSQPVTPPRPAFRPAAPPRNNTQYYRPPNPYLPGGSLYSPFNMGKMGSGSHN